MRTPEDEVLVVVEDLGIQSCDGLPSYDVVIKTGSEPIYVANWTTKREANRHAAALRKVLNMGRKR